MQYDIKIEAAKSAPAAVVVGATQAAEHVAEQATHAAEVMSWADKLAVVTILYIGLQAAFLVWKWGTQWVDRRLKKLAAKEAAKP